MNIKDICEEGHQHAVDVGFDLRDHVSQLLMIADEVVEALEHIETSESDDGSLDYQLAQFKAIFFNIEENRKYDNYKKTVAYIVDYTKLAEELADIVIRVCTYSREIDVDLSGAIYSKLEANKLRKKLRHGKSF